MNKTATNGEVVAELFELERRFDDLIAVNKVSFRIHAGDIFAFVGPNGAGKTTTMRILATLDMPTGGDATIYGRSVVDYPDKVRRRLGFMPDHLGVYSNLKVSEYIDFFARAFRLKGDKRRDRIEAIMDFTDLHPLRDRACDKLSKGMRQRLGLARTLIHDPDILILDEPAAGLDPRARIEFRELVSQLAAQGKAILVSSHILTELSEICTMVAIIERGKLLMQGAMADVRRHLNPTTLIRATLLDRQEEAYRDFSILPGVREARVIGRDLELEIEESSGEERHAELLREMVNRKYRVCRFAVQEQDLEDIFMQITTGKVQ